VTGEVVHVDCGYGIVGIPHPRRMTAGEVDKAKQNG
jgi:enoyl-[acyl-carrier-protein] reductase (NADH)